MRSGLHGLFRLDGAPISPADAAALDLPINGPPGPALARGIDTADPSAIHHIEAGGQLTVLAGHLDEAGQLASRLGLPPKSSVCDVARAALARFGAQTPAEMLGEWTLLHRDAGGALTLMASAARRDRVFYAVSGKRCAVSSDLFWMTRLPWIGRTIDEAGFLFQLASARLRPHNDRTTMIDGVRQLPAAGSVVITYGGVKEGHANVLTPQPAWQGSFEEACAAGEALLLQSLRARIAGSSGPAVLLSGGLDSSLLAWAAAEQLQSGQRLHLLTSVAPPGSGLADEAAYANIVADALGLHCEPVYPKAEADPYRPPLHILRSANGAMLSNRQPLTDAFQAVGRAAGATVLINGTYGEFSFTGSLFAPTWRGWAGALLRKFTARREPPGPGDSFHVRLSPQRLDTLSEEIGAALAAPPLSPGRAPPDELWGYVPGAQKLLNQANEFHAGALRMEFPYRDIRVLRLFAGMPRSFFIADGLERAPARRILAGRLPDSIRLRRRGMPASPDHTDRLQRKAAAARDRIATFRRAQIDDWFDLDWLDNALARVAIHGPADVGDANQVQITAMNAELLTWWRTGN